MGQPGNVLVNRAGYINFWEFNYKNLNSRSIKGLVNRELIKKILVSFFSFGYLLFNRFFFSKKWFYKINLIKNNDFLLKFFRRVDIVNKNLNIKTFFIGRKLLYNYYSSKIWIHNYQNWIIINWFIFNKSLLPVGSTGNRLVFLNSKWNNKDYRNMNFKNLLVLRSLFINQLKSTHLNTVGFINKI